MEKVRFFWKKNSDIEIYSEGFVLPPQQSEWNGFSERQNFNSDYKDGLENWVLSGVFPKRENSGGVEFYR